MLIKDVSEKVACDLIATVMGIGDFYDKDVGYKGDSWQETGNAVVTTFRASDPSDQVQILSSWDKKSKTYNVRGYRKGAQRIKKGSRFDLVNLEVIDEDDNMTVFSDFDTKFGVPSDKVYGPQDAPAGSITPPRSKVSVNSFAEVLTVLPTLPKESLEALRDAVIVTLMSREIAPVAQTPSEPIAVDQPVVSIADNTEPAAVEPSAEEPAEDTVEVAVEDPTTADATALIEDLACAEPPASIEVESDFTADLTE